MARRPDRGGTRYAAYEAARRTSPAPEGQGVCDRDHPERARSRALIVYLDSSALVKRYVDESASETVRAAMANADGWFACRIGFVEVVRAVALAAGDTAPVRNEWATFTIIEIDQPLAEHAADLAIRHRLRNLDALHLAAALTLRPDDLIFASWDDRLSDAAAAEGLALLPR